MIINFQLLTKMWSRDEYAEKFHAREVTVICDGHAYLLKSDDGRTTQNTELPLLHSSTEETDSRYQNTTCIIFWLLTSHTYPHTYRYHTYFKS